LGQVVRVWLPGASGGTLLRGKAKNKGASVRGATELLINIIAIIAFIAFCGLGIVGFVIVLTSKEIPIKKVEVNEMQTCKCICKTRGQI
jgi:hypothetical protein